MHMGKTRMNRELNKELFAEVGKLPTDELQPTALLGDGLIRRFIAGTPPGNAQPTRRGTGTVSLKLG